MKRFILICLLILLVETLHWSVSTVYAGLFSMENVSEAVSQGEPGMAGEIPVFFNADKLIQKRQNEARKLIMEGKKLIQKGEKKKDQNLIAKGQIKKEIGEKQLQVLKEQIQTRKNETSGW